MDDVDNKECIEKVEEPEKEPEQEPEEEEPEEEETEEELEEEPEEEHEEEEEEPEEEEIIDEPSLEDKILCLKGLATTQTLIYKYDGFPWNYWHDDILSKSSLNTCFHSHMINVHCVISPVDNDQGYSFLVMKEQLSLHISNVSSSGINTSLDGGVLHLENITNSTFTDVTFYRTREVTEKGGTMCVDSGVTGVTVRRSMMRKNSAGYGGGGIYVGSANTAVSIVQQTIITGNVAVTAGGGMYIDHSNNFNVAGSDGGGIYLDINVISASITKSLITVNTAMSQYGGGVFVGTSSAVSVHNTEISLNIGNLGGAGIYVDSGVDSFSITDSMITSNYNAESGVCLYFAGYGRGNVIHGCVIDHNSAAINGGGIFLLDSNIGMLISNSTITRNSGGPSTTSSGGGNTFSVTSGGGSSAGGGLSVVSCNDLLSIQSTIIRQNSASTGGVYLSLYNAHCFIRNSPISDNNRTSSGAGLVVDYFNVYLTVSYCEINGNTLRSVLTGKYSGSGGGVAVTNSMNGHIHIVSTSLHGNDAENGGGLYITSASVLNLVVIDSHVSSTVRIKEEAYTSIIPPSLW
eukprot:gene6025-12145_t